MSGGRESTKTVWPSGLRRWLKAPVRKGVGSSRTAVTFFSRNFPFCQLVMSYGYQRSGAVVSVLGS